MRPEKQREEDFMQLPARQTRGMRVFGPSSVIALALCGSPSGVLAQESFPKIPPELETVRTSLSKYRDLAQSETEFYMAVGCIYYGDIDGGVAQKFDPCMPGEMTQVSYTN